MIAAWGTVLLLLTPAALMAAHYAHANHQPRRTPPKGGNQ